jgi:membrane glycosyltransferase
MLVEINTVRSSDIKFYALYLCAIVLAMVVAVFMIYFSAHTSIGSLRYLNAKLKEIFLAPKLEDLCVQEN